MAYRKIVAEHLAPADARYRAQVRVSRGECRYSAAYRAEGLCGQCGRVRSTGHNCATCRARRNAAGRAQRAERRAKLSY